MPPLHEIRDWNKTIAQRLPPSPVAVFTGATKGIGLFSLRAFVRHTVDLSPRIYFVGRSKDVGDKVVKELQAVNPKATITFLPTDVGLMKAVDATCKVIAERETYVNLLIMSQGILDLKTETSEGLRFIAAVTFFSRVRFAENLTPLLQRAEGLKRVVSIFTATKEGPLVGEDWQSYKVGFSAFRGHGATMMTLALEQLARQAPDVTFVHNFPGPVATSLLDNAQGWMFVVAKWWFKYFGTMVCMTEEECGERQVFVATTGRYVARSQGSRKELEGVERGTDGKVGSGVYSVDMDGNAGLTPEQEKLLEGYRNDGKMQALHEYTQKQFKRICG